MDTGEDDELLGPAPQTPGRGVRRYFPHFQKSQVQEVLQTSTGGDTRKRRRDSDTVEFLFETPSKKTARCNNPGNRNETITIEDDDDDPVVTVQQTYTKVLTARAGSSISSGTTHGTSLIDLTEEEFMTDRQFNNLVRRLSLQDDKDRAAALEVRKPIPSYTHGSPRFKCAEGRCVELVDGSFLRIKLVLQNGHGDVFVKGDQLLRQNFRGLTMSKRRNEVVLVRKIVESATHTDTPLHEVPVTKILKNRHVTFTNQTFPSVSGRDDDTSFADPTLQVGFGPLFCRWKHTTILDERRRSVENIIQRLCPEEADNSTRTSQHGEKQHARLDPPRVRLLWRGFVTGSGGSHTSVQRIFDINGSIDIRDVKSYTFADAFCGAGGASRGAVDAGLVLKWGFDCCQDAVASYRKNFQRLGTDCRHESVDEFIAYLMTLNERQKRQFRVDILHISPPCQPFSPAHTIPSPERDEMNEAALPSVWHLIEQLRPRIVTLEETEGLVSRHMEWFSLLINIFTSLGYSVRWKIAQCNSYGVPQTRKRLLIIAAGPGEKLPPFPEPTHSADNPALKPLATVSSAISQIPSNARNHDQSVRFGDGGTRPSHNGDLPAKTITTNAGQGNYHPSGRRPYTLRELARLQTFPLYHSFDGARGVTEMKRQIGNAVPPLMAKAMFRAVIKSLKESDGV